MQTKDKEKIRQTVRERYGNIANSEKAVSGIDPSASCCGETGNSKGKSPANPCCGEPEVSTEQLSALMGYSKEDILSIPDGANMGLGCGNPVALASQTGQVIGVDMTPDMLSKARTNTVKMGAKNVEFRLGEIEHLPVADNSADIIMSNCVINLSPDKFGVYSDVFRVLKPGGRMIWHW